MKIWPDQLPAPLLQGYSESYKDNTIRSNMSVGPAKVRPRTTRPYKEISFRLFLKNGAKEILEGFYLDDLSSGSLRFQFKDPGTLEIGDFRFKAPPSFSKEGRHWVASVELEQV